MLGILTTTTVGVTTGKTLDSIWFIETVIWTTNSILLSSPYFIQRNIFYMHEHFARLLALLLVL